MHFQTFDSKLCGWGRSSSSALSQEDGNPYILKFGEIAIICLPCLRSYPDLDRTKRSVNITVVSCDDGGDDVKKPLSILSETLNNLDQIRRETTNLGRLQQDWFVVSCRIVDEWKPRPRSRSIVVRHTRTLSRIRLCILCSTPNTCTRGSGFLHRYSTVIVELTSHVEGGIECPYRFVNTPCTEHSLSLRHPPYI